MDRHGRCPRRLGIGAFIEKDLVGGPAGQRPPRSQAAIRRPQPVPARRGVMAGHRRAINNRRRDPRKSVAGIGMRPEWATGHRQAPTGRGRTQSSGRRWTTEDGVGQGIGATHVINSRKDELRPVRPGYREDDRRGRAPTWDRALGRAGNPTQQAFYARAWAGRYPGGVPDRRDDVTLELPLLDSCSAAGGALKSYWYGTASPSETYPH